MGPLDTLDQNRPKVASKCAFRFLVCPSGWATPSSAQRLDPIFPVRLLGHLPWGGPFLCVGARIQDRPRKKEAPGEAGANRGLDEVISDTNLIRVWGALL